MGLGDQTAVIDHGPDDSPGPPLHDWRNGGFGVYVHWPFCLAKCPYCDFNSHVTRSVDHETWRTAMVAEARHMRALSGPRQADTVFFGGGTPSLMDPATVQAVIDAIDDLWGLAPGAEITLEANPTSVEAIRLQDFRAAGVNRVSMGIQALNDSDLKALGRMHSAAEALAAFDIARGVFDRVSFDLIYARMGQAPDAWAQELTQALAQGPDHLSLYQLTIEHGTRFGELHAMGRLHVPEDEHATEMYQITQDLTDAAGLPAYEVSNHARPGAQSRHNLIYWRLGDYAGIGPGAHGRITDPGGITRATETVRGPATWLAAVAQTGHGIAANTPVPVKDRALEYMLMALRLSEGADLDRYTAMAGQAVDPARIQALKRSGHLRECDGRIIATPDGRIVLNTVLAELLA